MPYACTGQPSVCTVVAGDGIIGPSEQCDDGNTVSGDGCSASMTVETGWSCVGQPSVCTPLPGVAGSKTGEAASTP